MPMTHCMNIKGRKQYFILNSNVLFEWNCYDVKITNQMKLIFQGEFMNSIYSDMLKGGNSCQIVVGYMGILL